MLQKTPEVLQDTPQVTPQPKQRSNFKDPIQRQKATATRKAKKLLRSRNPRDKYRVVLQGPKAGLDVVLREAIKLYEKAPDLKVKADLLKLRRDTIVDLHHLAHGKPAVVPEHQQFTPDDFAARLREIDAIGAERPPDVVDGESENRPMQDVISDSQ